MVRIGLALALSALPLSVWASAAQALQRPALCDALYGLADAARASGAPQRVSMLAGQTRACRADASSAATQAFCEAADGDTADALPWRLKSMCLETMAADPQATTGAEPAEVAGRRRMTRLTAKLGHGVRLDVSYAAPGRYDVVVWAPR
ncbi:hypothetical protein [Phenylobacterium sp.]|uniref:hypothetical protein n=1 Tax=Phenylobacterium sp. TaxID=1871053 RepID=UPI002DF092F6|nr:hypothetical protein [Phenylobacterium sp.]